MAVITEQVSIFRLEQDGQLAGYAAFRLMAYRYRRRHGLRCQRWETVQLEGSVFPFVVGRPDGFFPLDGHAELIAEDRVDYRGVLYDLVVPDSDEARHAWRDHLSDEG